MLRNLLWMLFYSEGLELPPLALQWREIIVSLVVALVVILFYFWPVRIHRLFFLLSWNAGYARTSAIRFLIITAIVWLILSLDLFTMFIPNYIVANVLSILGLLSWILTIVLTIVGLITEGSH